MRFQQEKHLGKVWCPLIIGYRCNKGVHVLLCVHVRACIWGVFLPAKTFQSTPDPSICSFGG